MAEHYSTSLQTLISTKKIFGLDLQIHIARSIIEALQYLHSKSVVHRNFHSKNILISSEGRVKLSAYGLYNMTQSSTLVSFPIGYGLKSSFFNCTLITMFSYSVAIVIQSI